MNRYNFNTQEKALEMINALDKEARDVFNLGKLVKSVDNGQAILTSGYLVNVIWLNEQPKEWEAYEVFPTTPLNVIL